MNDIAQLNQDLPQRNLVADALRQYLPNMFFVEDLNLQDKMKWLSKYAVLFPFAYDPAQNNMRTLLKNYWAYLCTWVALDFVNR